MNPSVRRSLGMIAALFFATLAQAVYADAMQIGGARPDFPLAVALILSLFTNANGAAALGFFAGLLHASLSSPPHGGFGSLIVSRTLVCAGIGWLEERMYRDHALTALALVSIGTALAETFFFICAPHPNILLWARHLGMTTLYNALLAIPLYLVLRRLIGAHGRQREF